MLWQEDRAREEALHKVMVKGSRLEEVQSQYLQDPDIVLAALANDAEAWRFVCKSWRTCRDWVLEAVSRNWEVLQFVPRRFRRDRDVVLAAALQDEEALRYASPELAVGELDVFALEAEDVPTYQGECLRLVGDFNSWRSGSQPGSPAAGPAGSLRLCRTTDSALRLRRLPCPVPAAEEEAAAVTEPGASATRHQLDIYLMDSWVAFQVVSCLRGFHFHIYPSGSAAMAREPCRLQPGNPSAVPAVVGGAADGRDACFLLQERQNTVVSLFVEIAGPAAGQATAGGRGCEARVWYEAGRRPSQCGGLVAMRTARISGTAPSQRWVPRFMPAVVAKSRPPRPKPRARSPELPADEIGGAHPGTALLLLAEQDPSKRPLLEQVLSMSAKAFEPQDAILGVPPGHRLALLADESQQTVLAYCLYMRRQKDNALHVHQLAVREGHRGSGLGRWLLRWVSTLASRAGLEAVRLASTPDAQAFYKACGFQDDPVRGRTTRLTHPMELHVARAPD